MRPPLVDRSGPWFRSLDGTWRFTLADRPEAVPEGFTTPDFDDGAWSEVAVPGCWTMQGFDRPIYTNVIMPFDEFPPDVPEQNPTGLLPHHLRRADASGPIGASCCTSAAPTASLHCGSTARTVGVSKDSRLEAEFDVTDLVRFDGPNLLAAEVVRWSDASFVEDQDQWWHAGLHREVFLYSTPTHVPERRARDGVADSRPRHRHARPARQRAVRRNRAAPTVGSSRHGAKPVGGRAVTTPEFRGPVPRSRAAYRFGGHTVRLHTQVGDVMPWSAEEPNRYQLQVALLDPEGNLHDTATIAIGFRRVEIKGRELPRQRQGHPAAWREPARLRSSRPGGSSRSTRCATTSC